MYWQIRNLLFYNIRMADQGKSKDIYGGSHKVYEQLLKYIFLINILIAPQCTAHP